MDSRTVVADAGPLIAFGRIGKVDLLPQVLGEILVPDSVLMECVADPHKPGAQAMRAALKERWLIRTADPSPPLPAFPVLDAGESAAIRLAIELSASVLVDDKAARKVATNLKLAVIGSAGVLLAAKKLGLIASVGPMLDAFARNGYHFSTELIQEIRTRAGE